MLLIGYYFLKRNIDPEDYYVGGRKIGGYQVISETIPPNFFSLVNIKWQTLLKWFVTIVPLWFVGMTLYQRIYASNSEKQAKRAWFYAGLFEYPVMAFMGVLLGLFGITVSLFIFVFLTLLVPKDKKDRSTKITYHE